MSRHPYADAAAHLDEAQLDAVLDALDDAAGYRWGRAQVICDECARLDPARCAEHTRDEDKADQYDAVARRLRMEAGR